MLFVSNGNAARIWLAKALHPQEAPCCDNVVAPVEVPILQGAARIGAILHLVENEQGPARNKMGLGIVCRNGKRHRVDVEIARKNSMQRLGGAQIEINHMLVALPTELAHEKRFAYLPKATYHERMMLAALPLFEFLPGVSC